MHCLIRIFEIRKIVQAIIEDISIFYAMNNFSPKRMFYNDKRPLLLQ